MHAGPEIAVASTKAFLAQITAAYLLGLYLAELRGSIFSGQIKDVWRTWARFAQGIAEDLRQRRDSLSRPRPQHEGREVGALPRRHVGSPVALEGALKLKEIAYIHAEGFAAAKSSTIRSP